MIFLPSTIVNYRSIYPAVVNYRRIPTQHKKNKIKKLQLTTLEHENEIFSLSHIQLQHSTSMHYVRQYYDIIRHPSYSYLTKSYSKTLLK